MKLVIVGGVAGGASAATRARRLSEDAEIVLFERGPDVSFANCGLPYYIGGEITDRDKLLVARPALLASRFKLDVRTRSWVRSIDRTAKVVRVRSLVDSRDYEETYDKLILAPGAALVRPPIPGVELPGVLTLRNLEDTDRIKAFVDRGIARAVVIGGGFIGLEMVENFVRRNVATTLVELQDQVLPPLDREMTAPIAATLRRHGVDVRLGESVEAIERADNGLSVRLKSGETLASDLALLSVGVRPENGLAVDAGLEVGARGGIRVDEQMRTSDPDIYAVGDAVETRGVVSAMPTQVPLAGPANRQGRVAADHIFGRQSRYRGTQGTAILRVFDVTAGSTGETEKALRRAGRTFEKIYIHPNHHAGYFPGARPLTMKLLFEPGTGTILGAQVVGQDGVDKRIDILATAIQSRMTAFDLEEAELAYAPPFGSAKDPINMAGFVAAAVARAEYPQVHVEQLDATLADGRALLLDVRTETEFAQGTIAGAFNLPVDNLRSRLAEIPRDRPIVAFCQAGQRGYVATRLLRQLGFEVANLAGGYKTYQMMRETRRVESST